MARFLTRLIDAQALWARPFGDFNQRWLSALFRRMWTIKALLHPLAQGKIVDGQVECPWYGSRFRLADGHAMRGPTVYDQPRYEVRRAETGGWEARRTEG